jgi:hypothetical protein
VPPGGRGSPATPEAFALNDLVGELVQRFSISGVVHAVPDLLRPTFAYHALDPGGECDGSAIGDFVEVYASVDFELLVNASFSAANCRRTG